MARNKYPEITVKRILDVGMKLFSEKGYEETTIQNIIDELKDLSKGAIYHHFKSKEDIIEAVLERIYSNLKMEIKKAQKDKSLNGLERIKAFTLKSLEDPAQLRFVSIAPDLLENPRFLVAQLKESVEITAPQLIEPAVLEGIADGSISTNYPKELSQVVMILTNVWLNPIVFDVTKEELQRKCEFIKELLDGMGLPIMDEVMAERMEHIRKVREDRKNRSAQMAR